MPLIPMKPVLNAAREYRMAFGAFNINLPHQAKAAIEVHQMFRSAAVLQVIDFANGFMSGREDYMNATLGEKIEGARRMVEAVGQLADDAQIPVVLHLDHGRDPEFVKACVDVGYTSVMIDGSYLPFDENVELTADVVRYAHAKGVTVEGELGTLAGREDHTGGGGSVYTDPNKVCEFFERTGVDCLALSYGTSHGPAKGKDVVIRKEIAIAASENMLHKGIEGVLVSHGSSTIPRYLVEEINSLGGKLKDAHGIPIGQIKEVIKYGIGKVNVGTDLRLAILRYVRKYFDANPDAKLNPLLSQVWAILSQNPGLIDERVYLWPIIESIVTGKVCDEEAEALIESMEKGVKEIVGQLIVEFKQVGSAQKVKWATFEDMAQFYSKGGGER